MNTDSNNREKDLLSTQNIKALISNRDVENILFDHYGLEVTEIKELNGYDDKNFLLKTKYPNEKDHSLTDTTENECVFKVINSLDSKNVKFFEAQDSVLIFLANKNVCCPTPIKTRGGEYFLLKELPTGSHVMRLLKFIPGDILAQTEITPVLCYETGAVVATLHNLLKDFAHHGYKDRNTPWMLANVPQLRDFLFAVKEENRKKLVTEIIQSFTTEIVPKLEKLEKGLIHGDVNEQNILIEQRDEDWHVKGILDFGDSHVASLIFDVAITMAYMIIEAKNLDYGGYVLAGYKSAKKFSYDELKLLKICVCARFCQSLVMGAFTISRDPNNKYVSRTAIYGWSILEKLWNIPDEEITKRWLKVADHFENNIIEYNRI